MNVAHMWINNNKQQFEQQQKMKNLKKTICLFRLFYSKMHFIFNEHPLATNAIGFSYARIIIVVVVVVVIVVRCPL